MKCVFCHRKKYVGIADGPGMRNEDYSAKACRHGFHWISNCSMCKNVSQVARWVCERCPIMGETLILCGDGIFMIQFGKLVPDEKRWSNFV